MKDEDSVIIGALRNPFRREILKWVVEKDEPLSPKHVAKKFDQPLTNVAYHVRTLRNAGVLTLVDMQPVRGSLQGFYIPNARVTSAAWVREILDLPPVDGVGNGG